MTKILIGALCAMIVVSLPALAADPQPLAEAQLQQMAQEICAVPVQKGEGRADAWVCDRPRDYPNPEEGTDCPLSFGASNEARIYFGHFTADEPQVLAVYTAGCEGHVNNMGGAALFRADEARFKFMSYHPGLVLDDCVVPTIPGQSRQHLFCLASYLGQGESDNFFGEVDLSAEPRSEYKIWLTASSYEGMVGATIAPCDGKQPYLDKIDAIALGTKASEIVVVGDAYRPEAVAAACDRMAKKELTDDEREAFENNPEFLKDYGFLRAEEAEGEKVLIRFELPDKTPHIEYTQEPAKP